MGNATNQKKRIFIIVMALTFIFTGCGQSNKKQTPQQQSAQSEQQSEKVPDQLKTIESSVEKIIRTLNGPAVAVKEDKSSGGSQQDSSSGQGQEQKEKSTGKDKDSQGKQGEQGGQQSQSSQQGQPKQQAQQTDPWEKLTPIINDMHYKWNSLMPLSVKMGANKTLIENFGNSLNSLTNSIISNNKNNTLMAANTLYAYIPDLYALSKTKTSPEIKRIRHYTRSAILNSMFANWAEADSDINNLKSSWSLYKNTVPKEQQENSNKFDFSVYELEKVIKEKNQPLSDIKGRVAMSNIDALEKATGGETTSSGSEQSGGGSQSGKSQSGGGNQSGGNSQSGGEQ